MIFDRFDKIIATPNDTWRCSMTLEVKRVRNGYIVGTQIQNFEGYPCIIDESTHVFGDWPSASKFIQEEFEKKQGECSNEW
jgi:hypothetical protein